LFLAIDPAKFTGIDKFKEETENFIEEVRESTPGTIIPGDIEASKIAITEEKGLEIDKTLYENLNNICNDLSINLDSYISS